MATATQIPAEHVASDLTPEQALCKIFDIFEDALEKMPPEKQKAWLDGLSETVEKLEKHA